MASTSKIEWTEQTWNPVAGCSKISAGCKNCYAEAMARRLQCIGTLGYENGFKLSLVPERLHQPFKRKKPTMYFVNSMSDLFHEMVPFSYIDKVMEVIRETPQHQYQILTKRAGRMAKYYRSRRAPLNIWQGVTVENQKHGLPRIEYLRDLSFSIRFLSVEPLLEDLGQINLDGIDWVIVGGESGPKARQMLLPWVESIRDQCKESNVAFFFKQWGGWGSDGEQRNKKANGRMLAGRTWDEYPNMETA
jgi:protein gp37